MEGVHAQACVDCTFDPDVRLVYRRLHRSDRRCGLVHDGDQADPSGGGARRGRHCNRGCAIPGCRNPPRQQEAEVSHEAESSRGCPLAGLNGQASS